MVPRTVLSRSGPISVNTVQPRTAVNNAGPMKNVINNAYSTTRRPFNKIIAANNSNFTKKVNTVKGTRVNTARPKVVLSAVKRNKGNAVKASACWVWRPKHKVFDHGNPQQDLKNKGVIDSGCSRHMTGNRSYLTDYEEIDGGFVAFGGNSKGGKITGKGKIKTDKLYFEDVYFVKELKFNLFSVSQMCDKKNSVLFTDTKCVVLSPDFKLTDESHVLLKVPRKDNMYSVDLKNVVPQGGLTCLFAKATPDESNSWHRKAWNIVNFKTMIKLVRGKPLLLYAPQQNRVAERKNKTLIEAARTMLADSKLPTTFWAEAVNTACYVQNRVLVIKPHNKTPYELFLGRKPALSFMRPFGCPVTILNTIDHLGKFDGKADEGFFVGYSTNSKAFRVFNSRTRIVEENLHVQFSENTSNIAGSGPNWLFDIDALTNSMNYKPVVAGKQSNGNAGTKACDDAGKARVETVRGKDYILLPLWTQDPPFSSCPKNSPDAGFKPSGEEEKKDVEDPGSESGNPPEGKDSKDKAVDENIVYRCADDPNIPDLEEIGRFSDAKDDGAEADMTNLVTHIPVSPIPTTRIHKDYPVEQIIGDIHSVPQTKRMTKSVPKHAMFSSVQQRTNHKDFQNFLFACFLSQAEPKKVIQALKDPSWIEAMQDELLQFKLQQVWTLVDLPHGKRAISTKWVYRNKKDERGIVIRNKTRLVAQGYTQEEGIDYDEVFAPIARIEAIRIFLAYASFKDFVVYQMDVKSAFLYSKIEEEVYVCQLPGFEDPDFPDRVYKVEKALYDDIIFGSTKKKLCIEFEKMMHKKFQMSSMGELTFFLGLQVKQKEDGIFINQDKYMTEILKKFGFSDVKTASTPMETYNPLLKDADGEDIDKHMYRSMIGSLMYLTSSRPDCKKQTVVANSTTEAEYVAASSCCGQVIWIQNQLLDYGDSNEKKLIQMIKIHTDKNVVDLLTKAFDVKTVNGEVQLQALVDGKKIVFIEASVRRDLQLEDANGVDCLLNATIFEQLPLIGMMKNLDSAVKFLMYPRFVQVFLDNHLEGMINHNRIYIAQSHTKKVFANMKRQGKDFSSIVTPLFSTMMVQAQQEQGEGSDMPTITQPSSSQPQKKHNPRKPKKKDTQIPQSNVPSDNLADEAINEENVSKHSNNPLLSGEDRLKLEELMTLCTNLQNRVLNLEHTKTTQALEINSLKRRVKKLEKKQRSRTHGLRRLYKVDLSARVVSSEDEGLGEEDASKQWRKIHDIDADKDITLENVHDEDMFDTGVFNDEEVFAGQDMAKKEVSTADLVTTAGEVVTTANVEVSTASPTAATITTVELTLAQTLAELKSARPKTKRVVMQESSETTTTTTIPSEDKGKGIMVEDPLEIKKKDQVLFDEQEAIRLQAQFDEEERIAREKEEDNAALITQ
ncbi:retrovirus-related pol polyprotein from transposon TNT 1-94 [Tanacetum coccineum]